MLFMWILYVSELYRRILITEYTFMSWINSTILHNNTKNKIFVSGILLVESLNSFTLQFEKYHKKFPKVSKKREEEIRKNCKRFRPFFSLSQNDDNH